MPNNDIERTLRLPITGRDSKVAIDLKVIGKAESKKARKLLLELIDKAIKASENINNAVKLFSRLEYEIEQFDEIVEFFDVTPTSLAASLVQLQFHSIVVENWESEGPTVTAKLRKGTKKGKSYKLPAPTMIVILKSKSYKNKHGEDILNGDTSGNLAGVSEMTYALDKEANVALDTLVKHLPEGVVRGAMSELTDDLRDSVREMMDEVMGSCGHESAEVGANSGREAMRKYSSNGEAQRKFAAHKLRTVLSAIESGDAGYREALDELLKNDDTRGIVLDGFDEWRKERGEKSDNVMPMPGEIHGEA